MKNRVLIGSAILASLLIQGCEVTPETPHDTSKLNRTVSDQSDWTWDVGFSMLKGEDGVLKLKPQFWAGVPDEVSNFQYFIDIDSNKETGFSGSNGWAISGADYLIENEKVFKSLSNSEWSWEYIGKFNEYSFKNKKGEGKYEFAEMATNDLKLKKIFDKDSFKVMMEAYDTNWNGDFCTIAGVDAETVVKDQVISSKAILPKDMINRMGVGVDATWSEFKNKIAHYTPEATRAFAKKGFRHIRLRVVDSKEKDDGSGYIANPPENVWKHLDKQIKDALDNGMIPIIADQTDEFEHITTPQTQERWVKWWKKMAEHYKDYPYELMFDMIVEISAAGNSDLSKEPIDTLNEAYEQVVTAIRETGGNNDKRIIILSPPKRSDPVKLDMLKIPESAGGYVIAEFHEGYASGPRKDPQSPHYYLDGGEEELQHIRDRVDAAVAWRDKTGIPVWWGAWMPGNYNKEGEKYTIKEQQKFATDFISILNEYGIPHAVNATHKFYDLEKNSWTDLEPVVDTIVSVGK